MSLGSHSNVSVVSSIQTVDCILCGLGSMRTTRSGTCIGTSQQRLLAHWARGVRCVFACSRVRVCVCACVRVYVCVCACVRVCVYAYVRVSVCACGHAPWRASVRVCECAGLLVCLRTSAPMTFWSPFMNSGNLTDTTGGTLAAW